MELDNRKKIVILFAVLAVIAIFLIFPFSNEISSFKNGDTALKNWDTIKMNVTSTEYCGHSQYCILNAYTHRNSTYFPKRYALSCYGDCNGSTIELLVNPADPTQSITKEMAIKNRDYYSNPFVALFTMGGFCCVGIPFLVLVIAVLYLKKDQTQDSLRKAKRD